MGENPLKIGQFADRLFQIENPYMLSRPIAIYFVSAIDLEIESIGPNHARLHTMSKKAPSRAKDIQTSSCNTISIIDQQEGIPVNVLVSAYIHRKPSSIAAYLSNEYRLFRSDCISAISRHTREERETHSHNKTQNSHIRTQPFSDPSTFPENTKDTIDSGCQ